MTGRRTVIRGGLVLDPQGHAAVQDLLIEAGRVLALENPGFDVSAAAEMLSAADGRVPDAGRGAGVAGSMPDGTAEQAVRGVWEAVREIRGPQGGALPAAQDETPVAVCDEILADWELGRHFIRPALGPTIPLH